MAVLDLVDWQDIGSWLRCQGKGIGFRLQGESRVLGAGFRVLWYAAWQLLTTITTPRTPSERQNGPQPLYISRFPEDIVVLP